MSKSIILLVSAILVIVLLPIRPVHAIIYYFVPGLIILQGGDAYVPSFKLSIKFSYNTGSPIGIVTNVTRTNTVQTETCDPNTGAGTCWGGGYDAAYFYTDTVNEYDVQITANYTTTINETIHITTQSHGQKALDLPIPAVANYVQLHFIIQTTQAPNDPAAIAAAVNQQSTQQNANLMSRLEIMESEILAIHDEKTNTGALDQANLNSEALLAIPAIVGIAYAINWLQKGRHGGSMA